MSDEGESSEPEYLSREDMRDWLRQELANATKDLELRLKEATEFVTAYTLGKLTPKEADERYSRYQERWGSPLYGESAFSYSSDDQLIEAIDSRRRADNASDDEWARQRRELEDRLGRYERLFGMRKEGPPEPSR